MKSRREFLKLSTLASAGVILSSCDSQTKEKISKTSVPLVEPCEKPLVISTWNHGLNANQAAWGILSTKGKALDAVEIGVMVSESDPECKSVGYGGRPDREGNVTLDACIMDHQFNSGSVACLQHIKNPVAVARKVMEDTPHVMLVGDGAYQFALEQGFKSEELLTDDAKKQWEEWLKTSAYKPVINQENHDTIGMLAIDDSGNLAGACTTSGWAYKMHGRVGDSPIIGAGLYVDNEIGAACATGLGEVVIKHCGSFAIVELMRQGYPPFDACREILERIYKNHKGLEGLQVGFLALNKSGEHGACSIVKGFSYAMSNNSQENKLYDATSLT